MPAVGRFKGTPASISDSEAPQTEAIDEDPFELGDLRDDAHRVGEFVMRRQHRMDRAPGEFAVADFAPLGAAHASGFTDRVGREVVVQQELLLVGARQRVDVLLVLAGAERGHHHRLGFTAGEQRRAMGARQHADFGDNLAHRLGIAAIDALAGVEDVPANDLGFQFLEHAGNAQLVVFRFLAFREIVRHHLFLGLADRGVAVLLDRNGIGGAQIGLDQCEHFLFQRAFVDDLDVARLLRGLLGEFDDGVDHRLEVPVSEHHRAEHDVFVELLGFRFDHQHRVGGAGDDQIELGLDHFVERRVEHIFVIDEADTGGTDRALEGRAGNCQRRGGGNQRQNVGVVFHVMRQHGNDDLGLVAPALDEQRTDRTIDQAGDQRLLFGGPAFALEIAAGNASRGIGLFDVVDGQRQEVDAFARRLGGDHGGEHDGLAIGGEHGAVGLTGDLAGFKPEGTATPIDLDGMNFEHCDLLSWVHEKRTPETQKPCARLRDVERESVAVQRPAILPWSSCFEWRPSFRWYGHLTRYAQPPDCCWTRRADISRPARW